MARAFAEIAFTPSVRKIQHRQGSADAYAELLAPETVGGDMLGEVEQTFIKERVGFFQASVSETNWPYVQFRGGPAGFIKTLDSKTIAYADFRGNRQYVSAGNLTGNDRVSLILMDYSNRRRLKIWGRANLIEKSDDPDLVSALQIEGYRGLPERAVIINVEAFDWNCPQHIPILSSAGEIESTLSKLRAEIAHLTAQNIELKSKLKSSN